jgi:16S rRNA (guanine966-N2)-methyltransferase
MTLKIAGGLYKGLRLETPPSHITRPTAEMLRDAVFNICQNKIQEAHFLDLFAGSGAIGLEALSRGAATVLFVEKNPQALIALKKNIEKAAVQAQTTLLPYDVQVALKKLKEVSFDLVYIDPPYGEKEAEQRSEKALSFILETLDQGFLLQSEAWVFVEFSSYSKKDFSALPLKNLKWDNTRRFGKSHLHLFKYYSLTTQSINR